MKDVVIVSACRTAIGTFGGTLKDMIGARIAAVVMKEAIKRAGIDPVMIDDVRFGCCIEHPNTLNTARVVFSVLGCSMQQPNRTSSIMTGSIPARLMASFMTTAAMRAPIMSFNVPPKVPIAVLHADTITT